MIRFVIIVSEDQNTFTTVLNTGNELETPARDEEEESSWDVKLSDTDEKLFLELIQDPEKKRLIEKIFYQGVKAGDILLPTSSRIMSFFTGGDDADT